MFCYPELHVSLKSGQVLYVGSVGFSQEYQYVVYPGELGGLTHLSLVPFAGSLDYCLPDVLGEGLVGIGCRGQFAVYPHF